MFLSSGRSAGPSAIRARQLLNAEQPVRIQPNGLGFRVYLRGEVIGTISKSSAELEADLLAETASTSPPTPTTASTTTTPAPTASTAPTPASTAPTPSASSFDPRPVQEPITRADGPAHHVITV